MPDLIEFEWERAVDGYEIVRPKPRKRASGVRPKPRRGETTLTSRTGTELKPRSDKVINYRPLDERPALFREFADLEQTPEAVQAFANAHGMLGTIFEQSIEVGWYRDIKEIRFAIAMWERGSQHALVKAWNAASLGQTAVKLVSRGREEPPGLVIVPLSLRSAMYLQLAQAITRDNQLQCCLWCGTWFLFGTGTGHRRSAHYCSDNCRKTAWRHRKEK